MTRVLGRVESENRVMDHSRVIKPNIASLEVLDLVKINIEPETPISTLKIILTSSSDLSFTKEELRKAQDLMTKAFVQFHKNLRVLKSYW